MRMKSTAPPTDSPITRPTLVGASVERDVEELDEGVPGRALGVVDGADMAGGAAVVPLTTGGGVTGGAVTWTPGFTTTGPPVGVQTAPVADVPRENPSLQLNAQAC